MIDQSLLSQFGFFADLPVRILADVAEESQLMSFEPSTVIYRPGDVADMLYGIVEGEVELSLEVLEKDLEAEVEFEEAVRLRMREKASQIAVDTARPGHVVGWSALTGKRRRTVTATCSLPTKAVAIPTPDLIAMCEGNHTLGYVLMKRLADIILKRLDNRNKRLIEVWVETFGVSKVAP
ncbi:MAG: Crp/Fnr family transcriptional regulator [Hyphomicrobiales bacterium]